VRLNADAFDRRLDAGLKSPIAVAFSGGGDSLAALLLTKAWADRHGRPVVVLSLDHRLQPPSGDWIRFAGDIAARLGAEFRPLSWDGAKPSRGLAAAARAARHGLIAEAARQAGARVVVFGHTADDILEADLMRAEGSRLGFLREWGPSPVWPQGREVFLLRPLLGTRRAAIREALRARGETWIDDPANQDPRSARARARIRLTDAEDPVLAMTGDEALASLAKTVNIAEQGYLRMDRDALGRALAPTVRRLLAVAVLCVGGRDRPPRGDRLDRLTGQVLGDAPFQATLAGAKIIGDETLLLTRDAGEARRGGLSPLTPGAGAVVVWDGRFEVTAPRDGLSVRALAGLMARLDPAQRQALRALPASVRPGLPAVTIGANAPVCPILACPAPASGPSVQIRSLVGARFLAASGAISKETAA
jgi:tRNA(Ile)-lysidine synthase